MAEIERDGPPVSYDEAAKVVVVIGASAGGIDALKDVVSTLPRDLPASLCIVVHIPPWAESRLPAIVQRMGPLPARHPSNGETLTSGRIYVGPPGVQVTINGNQLRLAPGPHENGHRPAIDPLFRSAAASFGPNAVGVLLSGASEDGAAGLLAIKTAGGTVIVQDPDDAAYPTMPRSGIRFDDPDNVLPADEIGHAIAKHVTRLAAETEEARAREVSTDDAVRAEPGEPRPGHASAFTCPECGGTLWENPAVTAPQFQCRVGHAFSLEALSEAQSVTVEAAMWTAMRSLEESIAMSERIAARARSHDNLLIAERYERRAARLSDHAKVIRDIVLRVEAEDGDLKR